MMPLKDKASPAKDENCIGNEFYLKLHTDMPTKMNVRLTTYMSNKPDTFDIACWMIGDHKTKFVYTLLPYFGSSDGVWCSENS